MGTYRVGRLFAKIFKMGWLYGNKKKKWGGRNKIPGGGSG